MEFLFNLFEFIVKIITGKLPYIVLPIIIFLAILGAVIIFITMKLPKKQKDLAFDGSQIFDLRAPNDKIINGEPISVCYTLMTDDITTGKKPSCTPYSDRTDVLTDCFAPETNSDLTVKKYKNGLIFELSTKKEGLSEYGINLPFNFMGKKEGGGYKNQFLFNTPYTYENSDIKYFYLTKPNGKNLAVAILSPANGWKMDYSPYSWGHYFINLKLLCNFDRAYGQTVNGNYLKFAVLPVTTFDNCLKQLSELYDAPFIDYEVSGGAVGTEIKLIPYGKPDTIIEVYNGEETTIPYSEWYKVKNEGLTTLIPVKNGKKGAPVSVFGYESLVSLYKKSMDTVDLDLISTHTDGNLCEHQSWTSAMLRFLQKCKHKLTEEEIALYESKLKILLDIITEEDEAKATPHRTILKAPHDSFLPYNVYKSCRVQELASGIVILLDAYKYFKDEKYLEYLKGAVTCLISGYQKEDGRIEVDWGNNSREDYTTVCAPIIPIIDTGRYLSDIDPELSALCYDSAAKMAEYLYNRGLNFPTEGSKTDLTEEEMEDGSISCTALSLLYFAKNQMYDEKYIKKAKEILDLHENWVIKAPIAGMHRSTLRWWETGWEGDGDGPAICAGHAWSIWRGEADYLYFELTGDTSHLIKAQNTFMTNLSKINEKGESYANYNPDMINGGGFHCETSKINYKVATKFPTIKDSGLSRYVWIRINDTFLKDDLQPDEE